MGKSTIRIDSIDSAPLVTIDYACPGPEDDKRDGNLPIISALASFLPNSLDALILTAGLKGVRGIPEISPGCPLGVAVAIWLEAMSAAGALPRCTRTGVILAGGFDMDQSSDYRDEVGAATAVWYAFSKRWKWVAGVTGEGDSPVPDQYQLGSSTRKGSFLLDGQSIDLDSLRIGGIGGILENGCDRDGQPRAEHSRILSGLAGVGVDMLVIHECPCGGSDRWPGSGIMKELLEDLPPMLVVCGHDYWDSPLLTLDNGTQILNVAQRVVVLKRPRKG